MTKEKKFISKQSMSNPLDLINFDNLNELMRNGYNDEEIAQEFNVNTKFVKRLKKESRDSY